MTKPKNKIFIMAFVVVAIILCGLTIKVAQAQEKVESADTKLFRENLEYTADKLKDPFVGTIPPPPPKIEEAPIQELPIQEAPEVKPPEQIAPPALSVSGIIWGGRFPQAIINNKVVKIGDVIEDAEIIDITKDGVKIKFANQEYKLVSPAAAKPEGAVKPKINQEWLPTEFLGMPTKR